VKFRLTYILVLLIALFTSSNVVAQESATSHVNSMCFTLKMVLEQPASPDLGGVGYRGCNKKISNLMLVASRQMQLFSLQHYPRTRHYVNGDRLKISLVAPLLRTVSKAVSLGEIQHLRPDRDSAFDALMQAAFRWRFATRDHLALANLLVDIAKKHFAPNKESLRKLKGQYPDLFGAKKNKKPNISKSKTDPVSKGDGPPKKN